MVRGKDAKGPSGPLQWGHQMEMKAWGEKELSELARRAWFSTIKQSYVQTSDVKPIDSAVSGVLMHWRDEGLHAHLPIWSGIIELNHPPVPEQLRKYVAKSKWEGYVEAFSVKVQALQVDDFLLIFQTEARDQVRLEHWNAFGWDMKSETILRPRSLSMDLCAKMASIDASRLISMREALALDDSTPKSNLGQAAPRI